MKTVPTRYHSYICNQLALLFAGVLKSTITATEMTEENEKKIPIIIQARERGPGPGRYALPPTIGFISHDFTRKMYPAHSFGRIVPTIPTVYSPGPVYAVDARMTRNGRDGTACYSILARQRYPNLVKAPAPGTYFPENVHPQGERHAPRYSLGFRARYHRQDQNPSPNKYYLPPVMGSRQPNKPSSSAFSMTGRSEIGCYNEDLSKAPGPGCYKTVFPDVYKGKSPLYTILGRHDIAGDDLKKPGPGQHRPELVTINRRTAPKYSLGVRHSEYICPLIVD